MCVTGPGLPATVLLVRTGTLRPGKPSQNSWALGGEQEAGLLREGRSADPWPQPPRRPQDVPLAVSAPGPAATQETRETSPAERLHRIQPALCGSRSPYIYRIFLEVSIALKVQKGKGR